MILAKAPAEHPAGMHLHLTPDVVLALIVVGAVLLVSYRVSLRLRPHITCRKCRGTGKVGGWFFSWARDFCPKCSGTGLVPRLGTHMAGALDRSGAGRRYPR